MDETTMTVGLLMESAQVQQKFASTQLEELRALTRDLDAVVRDEIRRALVEELRMLAVESQRVVQTLQKIKHSAVAHVGLWGVLIAILGAVVQALVMYWVLPSETEIATLRTRRDELKSHIVELEREGGDIKWHRCGDAMRLCVRIDRKAPSYGEKSDYYVIDGY